MLLYCCWVMTMSCVIGDNGVVEVAMHCNVYVCCWRVCVADDDDNVDVVWVVIDGVVCVICVIVLV